MPRIIEEIGIAPSLHTISVDFYSLKGSKREEIINAADNSNAFEGRSQWYVFEFINPVYLKSLEVRFEGYESHNGFQFKVDHVDGTQHDEVIPVGADKVTLQMGKLANGFRFKPDSKILTRPKLCSIEARGFTIEEFYQFEWAIRNYEKSIEELEKREALQGSLMESISLLNGEKARLEGEIGKSRAEAAELFRSSSKMELEQQSSETKLTELKRELQKFELKMDETTKKLWEKEKEFNDQVDKLRLFPTEISGFVREGNRSTIWYTCLGAPFAIILIAIVFSLYFSTMDLSLLWKRDPQIDIWTIVLTRIPFVILAVTLIETCGYLVGRLIFEVIRINRQRLDFAKLSIIAKDVTHVSGISAGMTQQQIFDQATSLKMELLREHMKNYTGAEFEHKGSPLITVLVSVAAKLADKIPGR